MKHNYVHIMIAIQKWLYFGFVKFGKGGGTKFKTEVARSSYPGSSCQVKVKSDVYVSTLEAPVKRFTASVCGVACAYALSDRSCNVDWSEVL